MAGATYSVSNAGDLRDTGLDFVWRAKGVNSESRLACGGQTSLPWKAKSENMLSKKTSPIKLLQQENAQWALRHGRDLHAPLSHLHLTDRLHERLNLHCLLVIHFHLAGPDLSLGKRRPLSHVCETGVETRSARLIDKV